MAGVLSLADLVHPQRTVTQPLGSFSASTTSTVEPDGLQGLLVSGYLAAAVVNAVLLSLALRDVAHRHGAETVARRFARFALLHAVFGALALTAAVAGLLSGVDGTVTPEGPLAVLIAAVVLAVLALEVWFITALAGIRDRPWLQERDPAAPAEAGLPGTG